MQYRVVLGSTRQVHWHITVLISCTVPRVTYTLGPFIYNVPNSLSNGCTAVPEHQLQLAGSSSILCNARQYKAVHWHATVLVSCIFKPTSTGCQQRHWLCMYTRQYKAVQINPLLYLKTNFNELAAAPLAG